MSPSSHSSSTFLVLRIALAGLCAIPVVLVSVLVSPLIMVLSVPSLVLLTYGTNIGSSDNNASGDNKKHCIISGGSSGIGLSIARECVRRKDISRITLLARNTKKLQEARDELERENKDKRVAIEVQSVDVSDPAALQEAAREVFSNDSDKDATVYLFCCAGYAQPTRFSDIGADDGIGVFQKQIDVNQLGTIYTVHAFLPYISSGTITLTSSMAGLVGVYGYTAYSPTKFALRGFAEALHTELMQQKPSVRIQIAFPPDVDTPGYHTENETKPKETKLLSETAGLFQADKIAATMLRDATSSSPSFFVNFNLDGFMLSSVNCGLSPPVSSPFLSTLVQTSPVLGLFRMVALFVVNDWYRMIIDCNNSNDTPTISTSDAANEKEEKKQN